MSGIAPPSQMGSHQSSTFMGTLLDAITVSPDVRDQLRSAAPSGDCARGQAEPSIPIRSNEAVRIALLRFPIAFRFERFIDGCLRPAVRNLGRKQKQIGDRRRPARPVAHQIAICSAAARILKCSRENINSARFVIAQTPFHTPESTLRLCAYALFPADQRLRAGPRSERTMPRTALTSRDDQPVLVKIERIVLRVTWARSGGWK